MVPQTKSTLQGYLNVGCLGAALRFQTRKRHCSETTSASGGFILIHACTSQRWPGAAYVGVVPMPWECGWRRFGTTPVSDEPRQRTRVRSIATLVFAAMVWC